MLRVYCPYTVGSIIQCYPAYHFTIFSLVNGATALYPTSKTASLCTRLPGPFRTDTPRVHCHSGFGYDGAVKAVRPGGRAL